MEEAASFEEFKGKRFEEVYRMYKQTSDPTRKTYTRIMLLQIAETIGNFKIVLKISDPNSPLHASAKEKLELLESK